MLLSYTFLDRTVSNIEVDDEYASVILELDRKENNASRKQRRYCYSYDAILYEGEEYADKDTPQNYLERVEYSIKIKKALSSLTDTQRKRVLMLAEGHSINEIARIENIAPNAAWKSINAAKEKIKEMLALLE